MGWRRTELAIRAFLILSSILALAGQDTFPRAQRRATPSQDQEGSLILSGNVLNSLTGSPVSRALVCLSGGQAFRKQECAFTSLGGGFQFTSLPPGTYFLRAEKPSYAMLPGQSFALTASKQDVALRITPFASIQGKVTDANGETLPGVNIQLLTSRIANGRREVVLARSVATDDLGRYRLWNLGSGKYYLRAAGRSGGTRLFVGERTPTFDAHECFTPVYYGGAPNFATATAVSIDAGANTHADFSLPMRPAFKIRGTVINFEPLQTARFKLLMGNEDVGANRVALNASTGRFEIQDVVPGNYVLRVTQGEASQRKLATLSLTVKDSSIEGVTLPLSPGFDWKGTARFPIETSPANAETQRVAALCGVSLFSREVLQDSQDGVQTQNANFGTSEPSFKFSNLLPGKYTISFQCFGGYVASAFSGTKDLLTTHDLDILPAENPANLEIAVKTDGGTISGITAGELPDQKKVILIPQFETGSGAMEQLAWKRNFMVQSLAPGDYIAFLFPANEPVEFGDPDVVRTWTGGVAVHVDANGETKIEISRMSQ